MKFHYGIYDVLQSSIILESIEGIPSISMNGNLYFYDKTNEFVHAMFVFGHWTHFVLSQVLED